jgi:hypothetical protein
MVRTPELMSLLPYRSASSRKGAPSTDRIRAGGRFLNRLECSGDAYQSS